MVLSRNGASGDAVDQFLDGIDILDAYRRWCGKMEPEVGGKHEGIMISCPNPAHLDTHPSAWVNVDSQVYFCGVCQAGGDKFDIAGYHFALDPRTQFPQLKRAMANDCGFNPTERTPLASLPATGAVDQQDSPPDKLNGESLDHVGNGRRFVSQHRDQTCYSPGEKTWYTWDGIRHAPDITGRAYELSKATANRIWDEIGLVGGNDEIAEKRRKAIAKWAATSHSAYAIKATVEMAHTDPRIQVDAAALDADPMLFNVLNGTIDLRTGDLRPHDRADLITKVSPAMYDPDAQCPRWLQFLREVFEDDDELIAYSQRALGYTLTGDTSERAVFIPHGIGRNGKSVFIDTTTTLLGEYAKTVDKETLTVKKTGSGNAARSDLVRLRGARLAAASEGENHDRLAAALVKRMAGGNDKIVARDMYKGEIEFAPTYKIWLATNFKPKVDATDTAIWDRIHLIPFLRRFEKHEEDRQLTNTLRTELPGILAWAIQGCLDWQHHGLGTASAVTRATAEYQAEQDDFAEFLADECNTRDATATVTSAALNERYLAWCRTNEIRFPLTPKSFGSELQRRGFSKFSDGKTRQWRGLTLNERPLPLLRNSF
jgi:putative DNA primase/helicase